MALQDRRVESCRVFGGRDDEYAVLRPCAAQTIKQSLEASPPFLCALRLGGKSAVKVFEDLEGRGVLAAFSNRRRASALFFL